MTLYRFEEVAVRGVRRWKDPVTGKKRQETRKFCQTVNPFNRGADGAPKTHAQILAEVTAERDAWLQETP